MLSFVLLVERMEEAAEPPSTTSWDLTYYLIINAISDYYSFKPNRIPWALDLAESFSRSIRTVVSVQLTQGLPDKF